MSQVRSGLKISFVAMATCLVISDAVAGTSAPVIGPNVASAQESVPAGILVGNVFGENTFNIQHWCVQIGDDLMAISTIKTNINGWDWVDTEVVEGTCTAL